LRVCVDELGHVIDSPGQWPQWQFHEGQRAALLESLGFRVDRETHRFEFHTGEEAFKAALIRVSEGSLDRRRLVKRHRLGPGAEAQDTFDQLKSMEYDPAWWEPAFTTDDRLAGLEMRTQLPSAATIGYIGVAPEMRGKGEFLDPRCLNRLSAPISAGRPGDEKALQKLTLLKPRWPGSSPAMNGIGGQCRSCSRPSAA
jgi:hypothetical protein